MQLVAIDFGVIVGGANLCFGWLQTCRSGIRISSGAPEEIQPLRLITVRAFSVLVDSLGNRWGALHAKWGLLHYVLGVKAKP